MLNLKNHYNNIIIYNLITNFNYNNTFKIPKIEKITLNIGLKNSNIEKKKIILLILLLKLITNQNPLLTKSKKNKIIYKIRKGSITGCKITLRKNNLYLFLEKIILFIMPFIIKNIKLKNENILNFKIQNILNFFELEKEFLIFQDCPHINATIHVNSNNKNMTNFLLNNYKLIKN